MTDLPPVDDAGLFDEAGYLRLHLGIAEAVMRGEMESAWSHYNHHGRSEGRQANDVDPAFYLAAYPDVSRDLGRAPLASDAAAHYIGLGRARGYLPKPDAPRPANGAAFASPFGGFWTDQADVLDLVQGRLDLGRINRRDAALLRIFALDGIVEMDRRFDRSMGEAASLIADQAFTGKFPDMVFGCPDLAPDPVPWSPELTARPAVALDPHMFSGAVRDLVLDKAVTTFLSKIFDAKPKLIASEVSLRKTAAADRDTAYLAVTLPFRFVAVTFALQDTDAGGATVWSGSQRLPDIPWPGGHLALSEARRTGMTGLSTALAHRPHRIQSLLLGCQARRIESSAGTRMVRHANLVHAAEAPEPPLQRRSLTAWYCPSHVALCSSEAAAGRIHVHDGGLFSSGIYPALDPMD